MVCRDIDINSQTLYNKIIKGATNKRLARNSQMF